MRCYDTQALRREGRHLSVPFQLSVDTGTDDLECTLTCTAILRHLPGKRIVCAGNWYGRGPVVAKVFFDPSAAERHFARELRGIHAMQEALIPTPELLFEGSLKDSRAKLLLFRNMQDFENMTERLARSRDHDEHIGVLEKVTEAIARLHAAGLIQRDIHPDNFLVSENVVMVIDGNDIKKAAVTPLPQKRSLSNLALFLAQFAPDFDTLHSPVLSRYIMCRKWRADPHMLNILSGETQRWRKWRLNKFLPKTRRNCSAFMAHKEWRRFWACDREWHSSALQMLLADPDAFIESGTILKAGNSATVAKITIDSQTVVVKRYNIKNIWHAMRRFLRPSRAMASWTNAHCLKFFGIDTPRPLAIIEERWGIFRKRAYFIMTYLPGQTIDQALRDSAGNELVIARILDQLEKLLGQFAAAKISHGDFKASNFLISSGKVYIIDLDGLRLHSRSSSFERAYHRDLLRLQRNWNEFTNIHSHISGMVNRLRQAIGLK